MTVSQLMKKIFLSLFIFICSLPFFQKAEAYIGLCCGKCGGNMPMNIPGGGIPATKEFRLKISPMFMRMSGLQDGGNNIDPDSILGMPVMGGSPTGLYMAAPTSMDMVMGNITAGYSFTQRYFSGLMLMLKHNSMPMKFNATMQGITGVEGFTMKSRGAGDLMWMNKFLLWADDPMIPKQQVSLFGALSIPTGSINARNRKHPLAMRQSELVPYSMQLGSGTLDPTLGILYQGSHSPLWWGANLMYTGRFYDNSRDYHLGDEFRYDFYAMYQPFSKLVLQVQLNGRYWGGISGEMDEAASGLSGRVSKGDPTSPYMTPLWDPNNYGGHDLRVTAGLQFQPATYNIIDLQVGIPIYQRLNGPQLKEQFRTMLTWYVEIPTWKSVRSKRYEKKSNLGFES